MVDENEFLLQQDEIEPDDDALDMLIEEEVRDPIHIEWAGFI